MVDSKAGPAVLSELSWLDVHAETWKALGEERQAQVTALAVELKLESPVLQESATRCFRKCLKVFSGAHAVDWLTQCRGFSSRAVASAELELMMVGNLIRRIDDRPSFRDSASVYYRFRSDDDPRDGPSLVSIASHALVRGWLHLTLCDCGRWRSRFVRPKLRYCVLVRHGVSFVLYYYSHDRSSKPDGFFKLTSPETRVTVQHYCTSRKQSASSIFSFRVVASALGERSMELVGSAMDRTQRERWVRGFVHIGGNYVENTPLTVQNAKSIFEFSAKDEAGDIVNFATFEDKVLLIVNVSTRCPQIALNYSQLKRLQEEFGPQGLVVIGFLCKDFDGLSQGTDANVEYAATIASEYGVKMKMMREINVNGYGVLDVPDVWQFMKFATLDSSSKRIDSFVPWNFTKFLIGRDGVPIGRYDVSRTPSTLADEIKAALGGAESIKNSTSNTAEEISYRPQDIKAKIAALGDYYSMEGNGPFERSPVTAPSTERALRKCILKAVSHFEDRAPRATDPRIAGAAHRAKIAKGLLNPLLKTLNAPSPGVFGGFAGLRPSPFASSPLQHRFDGSDFDQHGTSLDWHFEPDRSMCSHLDDSIHKSRRNYMDSSGGGRLGFSGFSEFSGLGTVGSEWGRVLATRADDDVDYGILKPVSFEQYHPVQAFGRQPQLPVSSFSAGPMIIPTTSLAESHFKLSAAGSYDPRSNEATRFGPSILVQGSDVEDTDLLTPPHSGADSPSWNRRATEKDMQSRSANLVISEEARTGYQSTV